MNKYKRVATLIFNLFSLIFFLFSCSFLTNPDKTTISDTVKLLAPSGEGQTNHSGVKVSLYYLVELDTTLVRINKKYPNIGIQISQETEFYHCEQTPV